MTRRNVSKEAAKIMEASWANKTKASYNTYLKKWTTYCIDQSITPSEATYKNAIDFLVHLFSKENANYGVVAVARSDLSAILPKRDGKTFGTSEDVSRLLKGMFKLKPTLPRYTVIYDPDIILEYLGKLPDNEHLDLECNADEEDSNTVMPAERTKGTDNWCSTIRLQ